MMTMRRRPLANRSRLELRQPERHDDDDDDDDDMMAGATRRYTVQVGEL